MEELLKIRKLIDKYGLRKKIISTRNGGMDTVYLLVIGDKFFEVEKVIYDKVELGK